MDIDKWKAAVLQHYPMAEFILEDGEGRTYGEMGTTTAFNGPDRQAHFVGSYVPDSHWDIYGSIG